jgi:hypothetical protein
MAPGWTPEPSAKVFGEGPYQYCTFHVLVLKEVT